MKLLAINPGSTSTKIALFEDRKEIFSETLRHSAEQIGQFKKVIDQLDFRMKMIIDFLKDNNVDISELDAIMGRGGLTRPVVSGVYTVNEKMREDLRNAVGGDHASNLGGLLAYKIASLVPGCKSFITDPPVVDELTDVARVTGHPLFERTSTFHALNQRAIAKIFAAEKGVPYDTLNLIVAHMGGGISVGAHLHGRVVDINNAINGEGPFSPERVGSIPAKSLVDLCFSGNYTVDEIHKMINGKGGTVAHLGTNNFADIEKKVAQGDRHYKLIADAFAYNVAKEIGALSTVLKGDVDAILLTGGIAYGKMVVDMITESVRFIAPVKVYPGEDEMAALAMNGFSALDGSEKIKEYK